MAETSDIGACFRQPDRDGLADAATGPGDQRDVTIQLEKIHCYPLPDFREGIR
jgi:hypothetical protein